MKKLLIISAIAVIFSACGGNSKTADNDQDTAMTTDGTEVATDSPVTDRGAADSKPADEPKSTGQSVHAKAGSAKGGELIKKSDCLTCHREDTKLVGPAYKDVAAKYPATDDNINKLADKVIAGGAGNWGQIPMTPHPSLSKNDAKEMVKYILAVK